MEFPSKEAVSVRRSTRVLVVDDDPDILNTLKLYLSEFGYTVIGARSGAEAMRLVNVEPPDIMLVDLMMPGMSGTELMVRLREMGLHVPIIIISADVDAPRRVRGHAMQGVLIKPFNFEEMRSLIDRYVSGKPLPRPTPTTVRGEPRSGSHLPDEVDHKGLG